MQGWAPFVLLLSQRVFDLALNGTNVHSCEVPNIVLRMKEILSFSTVFVKEPNIKFHENPSKESRPDVREQTDG
jgi:hypothetical protein